MTLSRCHLGLLRGLAVAVATRQAGACPWWRSVGFSLTWQSWPSGWLRPRVGASWAETLSWLVTLCRSFALSFALSFGLSLSVSVSLCFGFSRSLSFGLWIQTNANISLWRLLMLLQVNTKALIMLNGVCRLTRRPVLHLIKQLGPC